MSEIRGGYAGRLLRVDLSSEQTRSEDLPDVHQWLGPRGWNADIAWNEVGPGVGPFDAENRLVFSVGPLVGSGAPTSGRMTVSTLAPRNYPTPMWVNSSIGGYVGAELKFAGWDGIIVQGCAPGPRYLLIENDRVSLRDAGDLWGLGVYRTEQTLKARHGAQHQVLAIGPAGENKVRFASIIHRLSNAVGNGGFGGVMGAKNLKAIVIKGTRGVCIAEPEAYLQAIQYVWNLVRGGLFYIGQVDSGYPTLACTHGCSVRCHNRVRPAADRYDLGSHNTMTTCVDGTWIGGLGPAYSGTSLQGEKIVAPGLPGFGEVGLDLANLAEDMGITSWAHYTWGHWLSALEALGIHEIEGEPINPSDPEWWHRWILQVSHREGLGNDYAEGLARFYDLHPVGPRHLAEFFESSGSRGHGWHREGRTMEKHPSPYWEHSALLYAVSTRDVSPNTHGFFFLNGLYGYPDKPRTPEEMPVALRKLAQRIYGSDRPVYPGDEGVEYATAWHQYRSAIKDSMGVCDYVFPTVRRTFATQEEMDAAGDDLYGDTSTEAVLFKPCTGIDLSIEEMERPIAERIITLERCIEIRNNGRCRQDDETVIPHYQWPDKTDGTYLSADAHEFRALLDRYYDLRGWDRTRGWPTQETLERLDMPDVAATLAKPSAGLSISFRRGRILSGYCRKDSAFLLSLIVTSE